MVPLSRDADGADVSPPECVDRVQPEKQNQ